MKWHRITKVHPSVVETLDSKPQMSTSSWLSMKSFAPIHQVNVKIFHWVSENFNMLEMLHKKKIRSLRFIWISVPNVMAIHQVFPEPFHPGSNVAIPSATTKLQTPREQTKARKKKSLLFWRWLNSYCYIFVLDIVTAKSTENVLMFVRHVHQMSYRHAFFIHNLTSTIQQYWDIVVHFKGVRLSLLCLF